MRGFIATALLIAASSIAASSATAGGGPITKQNGSTSPVFTSFTSICTLAPYADYGYCAGGHSTLPTVSGRINAVQPKRGLWNLDVSFAGLQPGAAYTLWGNTTAPPAVPGQIVGFFAIGPVVAGTDGTAAFGFQTTAPENLGFDLNLDGYTIMTSYWSNQRLHVNADGTLSVSS
jgi:hypothetical protein